MIATGHDAQTAKVVENLRKRHSTHTTEVRAETLPPEVQALLLDMADRLVKMERRLHDLEHRLDPVERTIQALAVEAAKRVAA